MNSTVVVRLAGVSCLVLAVLASGAVGAPADDGRLDPASVRWHYASYHGRKLFVSLDATVTISFPADAEARAALEPAREVTGLEPPRGATVAVELTSTVLGSRSTTVLHADARDAAALQRREVRFKGDKVRFKTLRFAERGVELRFHDPAPGEPLDEPDSWSQLTTRFAPYPPWADEPLGVTEPTALFYILAAAPLAQRGDVIHVPAWSKERLVMMELRAVGWEQVEVSYRRDGDLVKGPVAALKIRVDASDPDPESTDSRLELMGMRGAIEIFLERDTHAPLLIRGRVPYVGHAEVRIATLETR